MALKQRIKSVMPSLVLELMRALRKHVRTRAKQQRAKKAPILHDRLLAKHSGKRPIRVMFLMSNTASWKVGPVFEQMMHDPDFEPVVAVCPTTSGGLSTVARHTSDLAFRYLNAEGFPYIDMTEMDEAQARAKIHQVDPHVVFFTNPHRLVPKYLHDELLASKLTCYVPYHHEVMAYGDNQEQYNQDSHNAFWRIFVPHEESKKCYETTRIRRGDGVIVTGFPACEPLLSPARPRSPSPWKTQERRKKRVIYAPHWLWRPDIKMATIDTFGANMMRFAEQYRDDVQWALRPHPFLKPRLIKDPEWGPERTIAFFDFWQNSDMCQIHEDDYLSLFQTSDAMIHDSGSFLAEYLFLQKPVMYLLTEKTGEKYFNQFGRRAVAACNIGRNAEDIETFLENILTGNIESATRARFFHRDIKPHFLEPPSLKICDEIKSAFL